MRDNIRDDLDNEMDMQNDPVVLKLLELFIHFTPSYLLNNEWSVSDFCLEAGKARSQKNA